MSSGDRRPRGTRRTCVLRASSPNQSQCGTRLHRKAPYEHGLQNKWETWPSWAFVMWWQEWSLDPCKPGLSSSFWLLAHWPFQGGTHHVNCYLVYVLSCIYLLFVSPFVFYIGMDAFTLISFFITSFGELVMLAMVCHLLVEGTMTTLVRNCSLPGGFWFSFSHLFP